MAGVEKAPAVPRRLHPMTILTRPHDPALPEETRAAHRNFWAWVLYQLCYRIGWQFKMESTMIAGPGQLPLPAPVCGGHDGPLHHHRQRRAVRGARADGAGGGPPAQQAERAAVDLGGDGAEAGRSWRRISGCRRRPTRPRTLWVFFGIYTLFFGLLGAAQVAQGALLGKIIEAGRRGRALGLSVSLSGPINMGAILAVYWLVRSGAFPAPRSYALSFTLTVLCFTAAGLALLRVRERPSPPSRREMGLAAHWRDTRALLRHSANLRRFIVINLALALSGGIPRLLHHLRAQDGRDRRHVDRDGDPGAGRFPGCQLVALRPAGGRPRQPDRHLRAALGGGGDPGRAMLAAGWLRLPWLYMSVYALIGVRFPLSSSWSTTCWRSSRKRTTPWRWASRTPSRWSPSPRRCCSAWPPAAWATAWCWG